MGRFRFASLQSDAARHALEATLSPEDIAALFEQVAEGTPVQIVNQPVKFAWQGTTLFMEVHPPLEEDQVNREHLAETVWRHIDQAVGNQFIVLDKVEIQAEISRPSGVPREISGTLF